MAQYQVLYDQRKALRENASNVFQALIYRDNLWSNMHIDQERFCSVLNELINHPETLSAQKLKAYLLMLKNCNC